MNQEQLKIRVDKILWWIYTDIRGRRHAQPLCPRHHLRMKPVESPLVYNIDDSKDLKCEDCEKSYAIPRSFGNERAYVLDRVDANVFKGMKVLNLDDESIPLVEEKLLSEDKKFFVTGLLTKSKVGLRLVIYAGKRGQKEKSQIFVEPEIKRLAFDQNDLHPTDVFTKIEATFDDDTKITMTKN